MTFGFMLLVGGLVALLAGIKGQGIAETLSGAVGDSPFWDKVEAAAGKVGGKNDDEKDVTSGAGDEQGVPAGGAKGIVEMAADVAADYGTTVVSDSRPGDITSSGNLSDHSSNNAERAARDIGVQGVDALKGPPPKELDRAIVAIGKAFGKNYKGGKTVIDTFTWHGYRVQIIWRTPLYGGHRGHIHVGAHRAKPLIPRRKTHGTKRRGT